MSATETTIIPENTKKSESSLHRAARYVVNVIAFLLTAAVSFLAVFVLLSLVLSSLNIAKFGDMDNTSMSPTIKKDALIIATPKKVENLVPGDIIKYTACMDKKDYVRRIISLDKDPDSGKTLLKTKADRFQNPDPWNCVIVDNTANAYRFSIPKLGILYAAMADPTKRSYLIIGAVLTLIIINVASSVSRRKSDNIEELEQSISQQVEIAEAAEVTDSINEQQPPTD